MRVSTCCCLSLLCVLPSAAALTPEQRAAIDRLTGANGVYTAEEDTHKVSFPRLDVKFTVEGRAMQSFLGFSSWGAPK